MFSGVSMVCLYCLYKDAILTRGWATFNATLYATLLCYLFMIWFIINRIEEWYARS